MVAILLLLLLQLILVHFSEQIPTNCSFRAAVYEHAPQRTTNLYSTMLANVDIYSVQAKAAAEQGSNIIVFPEYGITDVGLDIGTVVSPEVYQIVADPNVYIWNPCLENATAPETLIVYQLSCIARNNGIYVVVNLPTKVACNDTNCPSEGVYLYNTDVAFNTEGTVVSRYHKQNLYNEFNLDVPPQVEYAFFDTPFGRMGMVTCFDLVWYEPLIPLVTTYHIDTLLFPTAWMDQLPFLASVQSQEAYCLGLGVNVLAANIHRPLGGFTGSGIYSPITGAVKYTYDPNNGGKLLIADLKCSTGNQDGGGAEMKRRQFQTQFQHLQSEDVSHTMKYEELDKYNASNLISLSGWSEICHGNHCCQLQYEMDSFPEHGLYKLMAYAGGISEGDIYTLQAEVCAVMWCQTDEKDTCSRVPTNITSTFHSLSLSGQFTTGHLYPSMFSAKTTLFPQSNWEFNSTAANEYCNWVSCANLNVFVPLSEPLLVASIYGRKYEDDCWPACN